MVIGIVFVVLFALALIQFVRFVLRFLRDEVEMEPGGSFGKQLLWRDKPERKP